MTQRVLAVGNCGYDHASIRTLIESNFDATVLQADGQDDTLAALNESDWDLVLINRVLDRDGSDGLGLIKTIKTDVQLAGTPVMLITNFEEHQQAAMKAGAQRGFGKNALSHSNAVAQLESVLGARAADSAEKGRGN